MEQSALSKKMGVKPGWRIRLVGAPEGFAGNLAPLPEGARFVDDGPAEAVALFCSRKTDLDSGLGPAMARMTEGGDLWIAYPKGKGKDARDLTRDVGWEALEGTDLDGKVLIALNESWSAFKFRRTGRTQFTEAELLERMFDGTRAGARPILERVIAEAERFGGNVTRTTRQSYVALARGKQFALLSPGSGGRLDVGLKLKGLEGTDRLPATPEFGTGSMTHKVTLRSVEEVDEEFIGWLRRASESVGN